MNDRTHHFIFNTLFLYNNVFQINIFLNKIYAIVCNVDV